MRLFVICVSLCLLVSCHTASSFTSPPATTAKQQQSSSAGPLTVAAQLPQRRNLQKAATLTAEFRPYQQVDLHAKVSGYLRKITVDVGTQVRAGELIAQLDAPELQAEVQHALASRKRAESELTRAQAEVPRFDAAVAVAKINAERLQGVNRAEAGLVAQQEIDNVLARLRDAEAQAAAARAQVIAATQQIEAAKAAEARAQSMLEYTKITAPLSGMVLKRFADPGALIQAGVSTNSQPLVRIAEIGRFRLAANVPEATVPLVRVGGAVEVRIPALNLTVPARFSRFTGNVQQNSRTAEVEIDVPNPGGGILPGMVADVLLQLESRGDSLTIPVQAFSNLGGNRYVLVVRNGGVLEERQIRTGMEGAAEVEVLAGLDANDPVVTSSRTLLRPGMRVEYKLEGSAH